MLKTGYTIKDTMVDSYEFGKIIINGVVYEKDLIIYPDRIETDWWREKSHLVQLEDIKNILNAIPENSNQVTILIGTGNYGEMKVSQEVINAFGSNGIKLICNPTNTICDTYNKMINSRKNVIAAMHLTC